MSFTDEALKAKLSTLNETQDSIVSVSQWIMFHKRHADRIANYWLTRLRDSPPAKRLNFVYLVNDIVQNARARKRPEFPDAFSPLMPEAISTAYRACPSELQSKIRRVVEVWRARNVFEVPIQEAIEARIDEIDKSKGSGGKKTLMGQSLFSSNSSAGLPKELETLAPLQTAVTKETISARPTIDTAQSEYVKLNDPSAPLPSPPVHAARLSSLIKSLAAAESSVSASIKARKALVTEIERILEINKAALAKDEQTYLELDSRKASAEAKKREVEDGIIRGLSSVEPTTDSAHAVSSSNDYSPNDGLRSPPLNSDDNGFSRPEIEELTPEPEPAGTDLAGGYDPNAPLPLSPTTLPPQSTTPSTFVPNNPAVAAALARFGGLANMDFSTGAGTGYTPSPNPLPLPDFSSNLTPNPTANTTNNPRIRSSSGSSDGGGPSSSGATTGYITAKRRKLSHGADEEGVPDLGEMGMEGFGRHEDALTFSPGAAASSSNDVLRTLDQDVDELIRQGRDNGA